MTVALFSILTGTTDGTTNDDLRTTHGEHLPFTFERRNNLSRQDAGQNILRSGRRVSNMRLLQSENQPSTISVPHVGLGIGMVGTMAVSKEPVGPF